MVDYEVIILGCGPAGLQAAIHAARAKASVLVLGRPENSSINGAHMENYFGISYTSGEDILRTGCEQAKKSGAEIINEDAVETSIEDDIIIVKSESGRIFRSGALVFTIGITRNSLNLPGEKELLGRGVSYCVDCDANFYRNKPVVITGNGSAAVSGALTLIEYTDKVSLVAEKISVEEHLLKKLHESDVRVHEHITISEIIGTEKVEAVKLKDGTEIPTDGLFIELGAKGPMELAGLLGISMDDSFKYLSANKCQETNLPGIYAAGDICGPPWQVAKAVGEGCVAGMQAAKYARKLR